jgi:hypothetical protein
MAAVRWIFPPCSPSSPQNGVPFFAFPDISYRKSRAYARIMQI